MLFPALAQAEDSSGIQYSEAPPTATGGQGGNKQGHKEPAANSSSNEGKASKPNGSAHSKSSNSSGGSGGSPSSKTGNAQSTSHDGGTGQGNSGTGSSGGNAPPVNLSGQASPVPQGASHQESGGSSPLAPILIAIAVLAAISIGAVMLRARRQRDGRGGAVSSPEAS